MIRRLPIYFLLDTSESMIGEPLAAMQSAIHDVLVELRQDADASEKVFVSFITFDSAARQVVPLTNVIDVEAPKLKIRPGTSMGLAFLTLKQCIDREVIKTTTNEEKGDYRPLVFLLTDGCPTDDAQILQENITGMTSPRIACIYSIACGEDVDVKLLQSFSDKTFKTKDLRPELIRNLFIWISGSIQSSVMSMGSLAERMGIDMDIMPDGVYVVEPGKNDEERTGQQHTIFFKIYCSKTKQPYLLRYHYDILEGGYVPAKTHKLEIENDEDFQLDAPKVMASQLLGSLPCPYCGNQTFLNCGCGNKTCLQSHSKEWHCVRCNRSGMLNEGNRNDFEIGTSAG